MRMWMVNPKFMCRQHLLGEHVEIHMFNGHLLMGKNISGYVEKNCVEVLAMNKRHDAIVKEMQNRGYNHHSPLEKVGKEQLVHLDSHSIRAKVNVKKSERDLFFRCYACKRRYYDITKKGKTK